MVSQDSDVPDANTVPSGIVVPVPVVKAELSAPSFD